MKEEEEEEEETCTTLAKAVPVEIATGGHDEEQGIIMACTTNESSWSSNHDYDDDDDYPIAHSEILEDRPRFSNINVFKRKKSDDLGLDLVLVGDKIQIRAISEESKFHSTPLRVGDTLVGINQISIGPRLHLAQRLLRTSDQWVTLSIDYPDGKCDKLSTTIIKNILDQRLGIFIRKDVQDGKLFVARLIPNSLMARTSLIREDDLVLRINGVEVQEEAECADLIRQSPVVTLWTRTEHGVVVQVARQPPLPRKYYLWCFLGAVLLLVMMLFLLVASS